MVLKTVMQAWQDGSEGEAPATKPGDLSSIPRTHTVEGKNQLLKVILWLPHALWHVHTYMQK